MRYISNMSKSFAKLGFAVTLVCCTSLVTSVQANVVANTKFANQASVISNSTIKPSLIEKAISQQNRQGNELSSFDLDMMNEMQVLSPTQSFFAAQHQRFSRLVQALWNNPSS